VKRALYNAVPLILVAVILCFAQGATVTTTGVQTLTHKTINGATLSGTLTSSGATLSGSFAGAPTFTGAPSFTGGIAGLGKGGTVDTTDSVATTSTSYVVTGLNTGSFTTRGGTVEVIATGNASVSGGAGVGLFTLNQDGGGDVIGSLATIPNGASCQPYTLIWTFSPTAGSHSFGVRVKSSSGSTTVTAAYTGSCYNQGVIFAKELSQ
jgi:hypothetical protein